MGITKMEQLAEAQILGYYSCENGESIADLVCSMGLTKKEWKHLKQDTTIDYLPDSFKQEIEEYLGGKK